MARLAPPPARGTRTETAALAWVQYRAWLRGREDAASKDLQMQNTIDRKGKGILPGGVARGRARLGRAAAVAAPASWHNAFYAKVAERTGPPPAVRVKGIMARPPGDREAVGRTARPGPGAWSAGSVEHGTPRPRSPRGRQCIDQRRAAARRCGG